MMRVLERKATEMSKTKSTGGRKQRKAIGLTTAELRFILGSARFLSRERRQEYETELQRRERKPSKP